MKDLLFMPPEPFLEVGFSRAPSGTRFRNGQEANNKLNLDSSTLSKHPLLYSKAVRYLADLLQPYKPEAIVGVPNGATGFAAPVAAELGMREDRDVYVFHLRKDADNSIRFETEIDENTADNIDVCAAVDDVRNLDTSISQLHRILGEKLVAEAVIFTRSAEEWRGPAPIPVHTISALPIPPILEPQADLWRFAK